MTPEVKKNELLSLSSNSSGGYDNIPAVFLTKRADQVCCPLALLFNMSSKQGIYPSLLKHNNIIPIFKRKRDNCNVESYRPISLQPLISKVFERIVNKSLRFHSKQLICDEQHG